MGILLFFPPSIISEAFLGILFALFTRFPDCMSCKGLFVNV